MGEEVLSLSFKFGLSFSDDVVYLLGKSIFSVGFLSPFHSLNALLFSHVSDQKLSCRLTMFYIHLVPSKLFFTFVTEYYHLVFGVHICIYIYSKVSQGFWTFKLTMMHRRCCCNSVVFVKIRFIMGLELLHS